jgi:hypothetical protein
MTWPQSLYDYSYSKYFYIAVVAGRHGRTHPSNQCVGDDAVLVVVVVGGGGGGVVVMVVLSIHQRM